MPSYPITLESILMPGTPESVRAGYASLAARAEHEDFGLLEEDIVILDTETTGLCIPDGPSRPRSRASRASRTLT